VKIGSFSANCILFLGIFLNILQLQLQARILFRKRNLTADQSISGRWRSSFHLVWPNFCRLSELGSWWTQQLPQQRR